MCNIAPLSWTVSFPAFFLHLFHQEKFVNFIFFHQEKFDEITRESANTDHEQKIRDKLSEQVIRWNVVREKCTTREHTLTKVSELNKKLDEDFDVSLPSVDDVEKKLQNFGSISVNPETLQGQMKLVATMIKVREDVKNRSGDKAG